MCWSMPKIVLSIIIDNVEKARTKDATGACCGWDRSVVREICEMEGQGSPMPSHHSAVNKEGEDKRRDK